MADLEHFKFDITEQPEAAAPAAEDSGAPQFRPDFGAPAVPTASREEEALPRNEFRMPLTAEQLREEWKPLGAWKFFGYTLLFALPLIGFVCAFVCAFSAKNLNLRNLARSYFIWLLLGAVVIGGLAAAAWFTGWLQKIDFCRIWQDIIQYNIFTK